MLSTIKLLKQKKNNNNNYNFIGDQYKIFKKSCINLLYKSKSLYFHNFISNNSVSTKKLWKKLSPFITPNKKFILISSIILNNTSLNSDLDLAFTFCNFFSTITNIFQFLSINICLSFIDNFFKNNPKLNSKSKLRYTSCNKTDLSN